MSKINIKVKQVKAANKELVQLSSRVDGVGNKISSVRHQVDGRIASRRSIGSNLNEAAAKVREAEKKLKKIHQFVDESMDLYVKADKKADRFQEPEKKSVWDKMKDMLGTANDVLSGFRKGVANAVFSTVEGIWNAITHPIETAKGIVYAVSHPVETAKSIWKSISDSWKNDVINGDAKSRSQWFGRAIGEVALAIIGTKGVDKAVKMAKGAKVVEEAGGVRVVRKSEDNLVKELIKETTCSTDHLYKYLKSNDSYLKTNYADNFFKDGVWPEKIQIPKSPDVLKVDGSIDWRQVPEGGYVLNKIGAPIKEIFTPKIGDVIDRYGPPSGRYTSPVVDGRPYDYDERSLPYIEDPSKYHQYRVIGDFDEIESYITNCKDIELKDKIMTTMERYDLSFEDLKINKGDIASGFGSKGGGIQYELPLPVDMLEGIGILKKIR